MVTTASTFTVATRIRALEALQAIALGREPDSKSGANSSTQMAHAVMTGEMQKLSTSAVGKPRIATRSTVPNLGRAEGVLVLQEGRLQNKNKQRKISCKPMTECQTFEAEAKNFADISRKR